MTGTPQERPVKRSWWVDALGVVWVAVAAAVLAPALTQGACPGSPDRPARYGCSNDPSVDVRDRQGFDQFSEFIPGTNITWTEVHSRLFTVPGMPLTFNRRAGADAAGADDVRHEAGSSARP